MKKEIIGWILYSIIFTLLLIPFTEIVIRIISGGIILGFFAGIFNAILKTIKEKK